MKKLKFNAGKAGCDFTGIAVDQHWVAFAQAKIPRPKIDAAFRPRHAFRARLPEAATPRFD
jgi:hypothetical protein